MVEAMYDVVTIGAEVSGVVAPMEAQKSGLTYMVIDADQVFSNLGNVPEGKPIDTYPSAMIPAGDLQFDGQTKALLTEDLESQLTDAEVSVRSGCIHRIEKRDGLWWLHQETDAGMVETPLRA